jgi:hypothetical protein
MRMGYQWLMFMIAPAILLSCTQFVVVEASAQELLQCFVESMPCGTPAELDRKVRKCLRDPYLCRDHNVSVANTTNSDRSAATKVLAALARAGVALPGPVARPARAPNSQRQISAPNVVDFGVVNVDAMPGDDPSRAVDDMANNLPLDSETRNLSDTMPTQPAIIERHLGLRRTQVAATDMRNRSPSPTEIVQALAPRERAPE